MKKKEIPDNFRKRYKKNPKSKCWEWISYKTSRGYGIYYLKGHKMAHRISYELFVGKIPTGLVIDHLCRNEKCVNPKHLEPVTQRENVARGISPIAENMKKTKCIRGHKYVKGNFILKFKNGSKERHCVLCAKVNYHNHYMRYREKYKKIARDRQRLRRALSNKSNIM